MNKKNTFFKQVYISSIFLVTFMFSLFLLKSSRLERLLIVIIADVKKKSPTEIIDGALLADIWSAKLHNLLIVLLLFSSLCLFLYIFWISKNNDSFRKVAQLPYSNPYTYLVKIFRRIPKDSYQLFAISFFIGLLVHLYMLTNKFPNVDEVSAFYNPSNTSHEISLGRWLLQFFKIDAISVPWTIGVVSLINTSLCIVLISRTIGIQSKISNLFLSLIYISFPVLAATLSYMFTAAGYTFAMLFAVLSAFLARRYKYGFIVAIPFIFFSLSLYQAYIFLGASVFLLFLINKHLEDFCSKQTVLFGLKYLFSICIGIALYIFTLRTIYPHLNISLSPYQGLDKIGHLDVLSSLNSVRLAFRNYLFLNSLPSNKIVDICQIMVLFLTILIIEIRILASSKKRSLLSLLLLGSLLLLIPIVTRGIFIVTKDSTIHSLLLYPLISNYILLIAMFDNLWIENRVVNLLLATVITLILLTVVCHNVIVTNRSYLRLNLSHENNLSLATRIVKDIEELPNYRTDLPIFVSIPTGYSGYENYPPTKPEFNHLNSLVGISPEYHSLYYFNNFARIYIGVNLKNPTLEEINWVVNDEKWKAMPFYPHAGSIQILSNIIAVKMGRNNSAPR